MHRLQLDPQWPWWEAEVPVCPGVGRSSRGHGHELDRGNQRLLTLPPVLGMYILAPPSPAPGSHSGSHFQGCRRWRGGAEMRPGEVRSPVREDSGEGRGPES